MTEENLGFLVLSLPSRVQRRWSLSSLPLYPRVCTPTDEIRARANPVTAMTR